MKIEKLVKMANEIGAFFAAEPNADEAIEGIRSHLRRFWDPRMRKQLLAWLDETGGKELSPLVLQAVTSGRELLASGI